MRGMGTRVKSSSSLVLPYWFSRIHWILIRQKGALVHRKVDRRNLRHYIDGKIVQVRKALAPKTSKCLYMAFRVKRRLRYKDYRQGTRDGCILFFKLVRHSQALFSNCQAEQSAGFELSSLGPASRSPLILLKPFD